MNPSDVRRRILDDHRRVRALLDRQDSLAARAPTDPAAAEQLRTTALTVLRFLMHHIDLEDEILVPALMQADAWGDVRVDLLHEHHAQQRAAFRQLTEALEAEGGGLEFLLESTRKLSEEMRADMVDEEKRILHPDILRDDVVTIGTSSG